MRVKGPGSGRESAITALQAAGLSIKAIEDGDIAEVIALWQRCGSTRACYQLIHLHPLAAFKLNPLMVLTLPFIVYGFLGFTRSALTGRPQRRVFIPPVYLWAWLVLLIFFWVFRNTPWYPFVS